jgi:hypothetical protein
MKITLTLDDTTLDQLVRGHGGVGGFIDREQKDDVDAVSDVVKWLVSVHSGQLSTAMEYRRFQQSRRDQFRAERKNDNFNGGDGGVTFRI